MDMILSSHAVFARVTRIVHWFTHQQQKEDISQYLDAKIQQQIHMIEQSLHDMETRPSKVIHTKQSLTPLTEQQKIIDLAG